MNVTHVGEGYISLYVDGVEYGHCAEPGKPIVLYKPASDSQRAALRKHVQAVEGSEREIRILDPPEIPPSRPGDAARYEEPQTFLARVRRAMLKV